MKYQIGERVSWRGLNREYTGTVVSHTERKNIQFALVRVDSSGKHVLLFYGNKDEKQKHNTHQSL